MHLPKSLLPVFGVLLVPFSASADGPSHAWSQRFGDGGPQQGWSVSADASGNVFLAGQFEGTVDLGGDVLASVGGSDIFLAKFDAGGNHLWSHNFTDPNYDNTPSIVVDASGNVVMSGSFSEAINFGGGTLSAPGAENVNVFVAKFAPDGSHLWSRTFGGVGGELNFSLAVDTDENIILTGPFGGAIDFGGGALTSTSVYDMYLAKLDSGGSHIWSDSYGQTGLELSTHVVTDGSDNILAAGRFNGTVDFGGGLLTTAGGDDVYLVKFSSGGTHLWSRKFGDSSIQLTGGLAVDAEENVVLTGSFIGAVDFGGDALTSAGAHDTFLAKFDANGNHLWSDRFGDTDLQQARDVAIDASGNIVITGAFTGTMDFGGGALAAAGATFSDIFLAAFASDGSHLWSGRFGDASLDHAATVAFDPSNHILLSGRFQGAIDFGGNLLTGAGDDDVFLAKFTSPATAVADGPAPRFELRAHPNPFNPAMTLVYHLPQSGHAKLEIYAVDGRLVETLFDGPKARGEQVERWDGRNETGSVMPSGVYFARLAFDGKVHTRKIVLLK